MVSTCTNACVPLLVIVSSRDRSLSLPSLRSLARFSCACVSMDVKPRSSGRKRMLWSSDLESAAVSPVQPTRAMDGGSSCIIFTREMSRLPADLLSVRCRRRRLIFLFILELPDHVCQHGHVRLITFPLFDSYCHRASVQQSAEFICSS